VDALHEITKIDRWFLRKLAHLAAFEGALARGLDVERYREAKQLGYTDAAIARISGARELPKITSSYRMVDTCAGEHRAVKPYFYQVFGGACEARAFPNSGKRKIMVLGSGPIRIGQGIEFDYSSVHCVRTLREMGYEVIIVNNNPETVSTDYDTADRLYFEPLTGEDVLRIIEAEQPEGVVVAFGGQTAIKLTGLLDARGIPILGTSAEGIDLAEDRARFDVLLGSMGIRRPAGRGVSTLADAISAADALGYPVLLRPSYVIGGQNMRIAHSEADVRAYMARILAAGIDSPVLIDKYMQGPELEVDCISDGEEVLIPGVMEHIESAGVHSGDSIAVYPPYSLDDAMLNTVIATSKKLALALGTKGLVNIQYLIWRNELYVIEVNPRASRTIPYISKVTGVPMVEIAARVMLGEKLRGMGYGTGLYKAPPYYAVKVPVFSFEKLTGANAMLGPEMKSTGEVLGVGRTLPEALFKGLRAAGIRVPSSEPGHVPGVILSVDEHEHHELVHLAKKLHDRRIRMYATSGTARTIARLGIDVTTIGDIGSSGDAEALIESGKITFIVYTGALYDSTQEHFAALNRRALNHAIACFTSMGTANAMADVIAGQYNTNNTELVDICNMRAQRQVINYVKMQDLGNDYILLENFDGAISCPESLALQLCDRHRGVGADGIALIEKSKIADARMRMFNRDGSEGRMAANCLRYVGKYLYDNAIARKEILDIETASGVRRLRLVAINGETGAVNVGIGKAQLLAAKVPVICERERVIDMPVEIGGAQYRITCLSLGNPHCVVFVDNVDALDLADIGPRFEKHLMFPERVNTEFVHVVDESVLTMRVWERGSGETSACGSGACAAVVAAVELGHCKPDSTVTVKLAGGDLKVRYTHDEFVILTGGATLVCEGRVWI
ncbi:MAG: carbamoyl-phosphate synthase large subunit, partial [Christensenellales bacterium]|jgi:carbamoyl-phosphate synthase large subunit